MSKDFRGAITVNNDYNNNSCLRQLLNITRRDRIINEAILSTTGLTSLQDILSKRRTSLFGHVARLSPDVPARQALWMQARLSTGRKSDVR